MADQLAAAVQAGNLVLFFGAGVSVDAGIPAWQSLLDHIATVDAGIGDELTELRRLDLRDQAAILHARLALKGKDLGQVIADHVKAARYSLAHSLLASLQVREAVTTNYDNLFEVAVRDRGDDSASLTVLPGKPVPAGESWLLKLHGSIDDHESIVATRDDYLGIATRRGALLGLVQAMLLTRQMLFVGYSLTDDDFHSIVNDVRMAAPPDHNLGIALTLFQNDFFEELWEGNIDVVSVSNANSDPTEEDISEASRRALIFLDYLAYASADLHNYLLRPEYGDIKRPHSEDVFRGDAEDDLASLLRRLIDGSDSTLARKAPGWQRVEMLLSEFGWSPPDSQRADPKSGQARTGQE